MPGSESLRTDRGDPERVDLARLDPGLLAPHVPPRRGVRDWLDGVAWVFPAALEEMRLWARTGRAKSLIPDPVRAFYPPDADVDESGDGGLIAGSDDRHMPPPH